MLLSALAAGAMFWQQNRIWDLERRRDGLNAEMNRLRALLAAIPDSYCAWTGTGAIAVSPTLGDAIGAAPVERLDDIEDRLEQASARALRDGFTRLRRDGERFAIEAALGDGRRTLRILGNRGTSPDGRETVDLLWFTDITGTVAETRRQAEALEEAKVVQGELRTALDILPMPIWLRRADLDLVWCNRSYGKAVDAQPESAVNHQRELTTGGGTSGRALAERAWAEGTAQSETRHVVVGGSRRLLEVTEAPLPNGRAGRGLVVGYALDITGLKDVKDELSRHVSAHAEVLEQLGSAIAIYGPDMRLKFYNTAYVQLWGFDEAWLETEPTFGEVLEDQRARRRLPEHADFPRYKKERIAMFTSLIEQQEDLMHLPDGTTLRTLIVPHPFGGLMFILEDVTNALALESSYNTLIAVQQETLDNLAEGIAVFGGDGRLKLSNPAYARIWDLRQEDLAGEPHVADVTEKIKGFFDHGENWEGMKDELVGSALDRAARAGRIERTDGSVIEFSYVPLPDGAVLHSFLDVTDSVRVEQALRASNEALETADRLKSEFIANVSYQLRTPLNAIMGFAEILANQYFGELNERQLEYSRGVLESGQRLLSLINDILDLATIEAGYMRLDLGEIDVEAMLGSVATLTREWVRKQSLRLDVDCRADIGLIEADEKRLKQALFNLVSNATKFTPPGGRIMLSAERIDDAVVMTVSDTGIGIPVADQERVFGRFERANPQARQAGAGLGLSLVKSFIELHGGQVEIDSRPGEGTRIRCILPIHAESPASASVPAKIASTI